MWLWTKPSTVLLVVSILLDDGFSLYLTLTLSPSTKSKSSFKWNSNLADLSVEL
nr:hypothetical protein [Ureaplasma urealyticum]